ncbi:MAG: hypothetical protein K8M05_00035, partial [Deltaproteobacteria bacterium]|nr:hypothetical protein [Kofleriaceae bacterium]
AASTALTRGARARPRPARRDRAAATATAPVSRAAIRSARQRACRDRAVAVKWPISMRSGGRSRMNCGVNQSSTGRFEVGSVDAL